MEAVTYVPGRRGAGSPFVVNETRNVSDNRVCHQRVNDDDTVRICTEAHPVLHKTASRVVHPDAEVVTSNDWNIGMRCPWCGTQWWEADEGG